MFVPFLRGLNVHLSPVTLFSLVDHFDTLNRKLWFMKIKISKYSFKFQIFIFIFYDNEKDSAGNIELEAFQLSWRIETKSVWSDSFVLLFNIVETWEMQSLQHRSFILIYYTIVLYCDCTYSTSSIMQCYSQSTT